MKSIQQRIQYQITDEKIYTSKMRITYSVMTSQVEMRLTTSLRRKIKEQNRKKENRFLHKENARELQFMSDWFFLLWLCRDTVTY